MYNFKLYYMRILVYIITSGEANDVIIPYKSSCLHVYSDYLNNKLIFIFFCKEDSFEGIVSSPALELMISSL